MQTSNVNSMYCIVNMDNNSMQTTPTFKQVTTTPVQCSYLFIVQDGILVVLALAAVDEWMQTLDSGSRAGRPTR